MPRGHLYELCIPMQVRRRSGTDRHATILQVHTAGAYLCTLPIGNRETGTGLLTLGWMWAEEI